MMVLQISFSAYFKIGDEGSTADDINPALPIIRNIPELPWSTAMQCRIRIINRMKVL